MGDVRKKGIMMSFIQELSMLLDKGENVAITDLEMHVQDNTVLQWLGVMQQWDQTAKLWLTTLLADDLARALFHSDDHYGINSNGLCLLVSWAAEILMDL